MVPMATYETVVQESGSFDVVDAAERPYRVIETTECMYRVSVTKRYLPISGRVTYRLLDGREVRRSHLGYFDTMDGLTRFFVVHAEEAQRPCEQRMPDMPTGRRASASVRPALRGRSSNSGSSSDSHRSAARCPRP